MAKKITKHDDIIDIRDVIARFEELSAIRDKNIAAICALREKGEFGESLTIARRAHDDWANGDEGGEFFTLQALLEAAKGNGGDEQWRGDWYPVTLIRWDQAARELLMDYTTISFDGIDYHCR
jgi:hypothetical protein